MTDANITLEVAITSAATAAACEALDMAKDEASCCERAAPLASSYNDHIRPLLDAVDRLRRLQVMKEGIQLPTIVVVGDQSSGKSSVLESLARISLPRGQGICTRVPLIMRLQDDPSAATSEALLQLEYRDKVVPTTEAGITGAINAATEEIAGQGKCISGEPLTLVVRKKGVPDLTMVDLPGITRVPVHGQPEDIYEQISNIIMEYITPAESIILNVLSATVDFPTCESIRMSQRVDKTGERTLAVVTKSDKAPEGLLEKVTADDVNIGLGYVCVRNRIGDESYEEARAGEERLFTSHPLLSKMDKSIVGIPVLAQRLVQIQASSIARCLPDIVKKINEKLNRSMGEFNDMPPTLASGADAMRTFLRILGQAKESLRKVLVRGEYEEFPDDTDMHGTARLADMLNRYAGELPSTFRDGDCLFLMEEITELAECKELCLPAFLPRAAFLNILRRKVQGIAHTPAEFVTQVWSYVERVVLRILMHYCDNYPPLQSATRRAAQNLIEKVKNRSLDHVKLMVEIEKMADYTSNADYRSTWASLMEQLGKFMNSLEELPAAGSPFGEKTTKLSLKLIGDVDVGHLREHKAVAEEAFDMRMRLVAYWRIVVVRIVDGLALHLLHSVRKLVEEEIESEILNELVGSNKNVIERMLEESPGTAAKRERLKSSIKLLKESKEVVAKIMDSW
ncbi:hypothetical protein Taro_035091 [Colocasia esculenta]|uniref:Dynamin-related protein 4C n=1 Tax=Colocasia esculenta TaxID=4460 RepID=A0A843WDV0_COLES|nr:hypothetical protein [Colocasia esculenta]